MNGHLLEIKEGMKVFDRTGEEIGTVDWVHFSDEDPATPQAETSSVSRAVSGDANSLLERIARTFAADSVPEVLRDRLLREGFVKIDARGLFAHDRYALPAQVERVTDDGVMLSATKDELIRRP